MHFNVMNLIKEIFRKEKREMRKEKTVKILVMGKSGVGKTSVIKQLCCNQDLFKNIPTCYDIYREKVLVDDYDTTMEFMDFGGTDMFPKMRDIFIQRADIFMLVYSCDDKESFIRVNELRGIISKVKNKHYTEIPIIVVRNKTDLLRKSKKERLQKKSLMQNFYVTHDVSTVTGIKINEIMDSLIKESKFIGNSEDLKSLQYSGRYIYDEKKDSIIKSEQYHKSPTLFRNKETSDEKMQRRRTLSIRRDSRNRFSALL
ncbi:ras-related protein Rap-2a-like [Hydra vulgaris]|uniref:Ras-related protein Rap-2a-like n=1 Tax=Hydra vulgaris TaxID=6087 RepID=A0ABM4CW09_HYDVU